MRRRHMNKNQRNRQRGIALVSVLLVLVMLIVMGIALMYVADTDTAINANYRSEQQSYFAAKAGIEEVRGRMRRTATNTLDASGSSLLPTTVPSDAGGVLYVINQGTDPITIQPWVSGNRYVDDELCHDGYVMTGIPAPGSAPSDDVRCTAGGYLPTSGNWYNHPVAAAPAPGYATSTAPFNGSAAALPYKWVRVTWKQNNSIQGTPAQPYTVDGSAPSSATGTTPVCWDGSKEVLLQAPATKCEQMTSGMRPVYLATSLALSGGSRRMVQAELAKTTVPTFPAALALDGPEAVFSAYSSNNAIVSGWDAAASGGGTPCPPSGNWPGIGTYTDYDATQVIVALNAPSVKTNNFTGGPSNNTDYNVINIGPWGQYKDSTGTANAVPQTSSPFYPGNMGNLNKLATVSGLQALVTTITQSADVILSGGGSIPLPLGTDSNPQITVIIGDVSFNGGGSIGAGMLLVTGKLTISGNTSFDGAIYVIGKGYFDTSGDPNYNGQVLVANIVNPPPNPPNPAILAVLKAVYGPSTTQYPPDTPGSPTFNGGGGGGNGGVGYNSCKANLGNDRIPYKVLATREILY